MHADYLPRMLFCAGRMFEMPVTDTLHPPPCTLPHHKYNVPLSSSGRVQSNIAEFCRVCFFCFFFPVLSMSAHTLTMWSNKVKCELFSQGDFKEMLVYSTVFQAILVFLLDPPLCHSLRLSPLSFSF